MQKNGRIFSYSIYKSLVDNGLNRFMSGIVGFLFRQVDFDSESLSTLSDLSGKGRIVFASFQNNNTSLLILTSLLKKHKLAIPSLAIGFRNYSIQIAASYINRIIAAINNNPKKVSGPVLSDQEFIEDELACGESLAFSFYSKELFTKRYLDRDSDILQWLLEIQKKSTDPIYLLPQMIFWNRNPEKTRTIVTSKATGDWGIIPSFFTMKKSITPPSMRICSPIDLRDVLADETFKTNEARAQFIRKKIMEVYDNEKRTVLGPVIKTQGEMVDQVLSHKNVIDEIAKEAASRSGSEKKLRRKAYEYYREIAADFSIVMIKYFSKTLEGYIFKKLFSGISYNLDDLRKIREASQKGPVVFMPCHKSHLDYLILSSLFYQNMLIPPHILSGSNLIFFPMGFIFRKSGAFFMRRSFRGLDLYAAVFKQYVKTLVKEGYGIEFFVEGGRSRTGRIGHPQMGFLKYLIDSIEEGYNSDMVFIPVAINYDRIVEENSYHKELKGKKKEKENTSAFLKSRRFLNRKHGKVYFSINGPVSYQELKAQYGKTENLTRDIAYHVIKKVNDIIKVTPFSLVTSAMLYSSGRGFSREYLTDRVSALYDYVKFMGIDTTDELATEKGMSDVISYVLESYRQDSIITELNLDGINREEGESSEILYVLNDDDRPRINFYKNTILHYMLPAAFTAVVLMCQSKDGKMTREKVRDGCVFLHQLFRREFIYSGIMEDVERISEKALAFFESTGAISITGSKITVNGTSERTLRFFARALQDFFESYLIVLSHVLSSKIKSTPRRDLINDVRKTGIRMFHEGEIKLSEALSLSNYENALTILCDMKVLKEHDAGKKNKQLTMSDLKKGEQLREKIINYAGVMNIRSSVKSAVSYSDMAKEAEKKAEDTDRIH